MRTERSEALSLLRKWKDESALLACEVSMRTLASFLEGRVIEVTDERVSVKSDDGRAELLLDLRAVVCFGSADAQRIPDLGDAFDFGLVALFADPDESEHPESASFVEKRG